MRMQCCSLILIALMFSMEPFMSSDFQLSKMITLLLRSRPLQTLFHLPLLLLFLLLDGIFLWYLGLRLDILFSRKVFPDPCYSHIRPLLLESVLKQFSIYFSVLLIDFKLLEDQDWTVFSFITASPAPHITPNSEWTFNTHLLNEFLGMFHCKSGRHGSQCMGDCEPIWPCVKLNILG